MENQVLTWQYDAVGNNTWFQEVKDGVAISTVTKEFDSASANLFTRTVTTKDGTTDTQEVSQQYDAAGRVSKTTMRTFGKTNKTYYYVYDYHGDGRESGIRAFGDASGNASFVYNSNDKLITLNQGKGDGMDRAEVSQFVYDSANQILAKYHDGGKGDARDRIEYLYAQGNPVAETGVKIEGGAFTLMDTENYALFQHYSKDFPGGSMMSYTVNGDGETLQSIANAMYGNPSQWYLIAGANGLSGSEKLKAGQVLSVPSKNSSGEIDESAHKTYNENEIVGSKLPNLQAPPPPKKKKCASLLMILVVIIAVVVTIYTAGAAAGMMGVATGATTTMGAGLAVLTGSAGLSMAAVGAAVIGGAVGSIASQAFAVGVGLQESINWKSVALSAIGSGLTAGIGAVGTFANTGSQVLNAGLNAAASNVATQGLAIAFKMQDKFSWRQVAAAGVSAAVGDKIGKMFGSVPIDLKTIQERVLTAGAQSITNQLIMKGKVDWRSVGVEGAISFATHLVNDKFKGKNWERTVANGLLGAGSAALRKQNVLAGTYSGVAGSLIAQHAPRATGMQAHLLKGLVGAGTAALTKQDIAAGFIGGAAGSIVSEYVIKGAEALGVDTLAEDARTKTPEYVLEEAKRLGVDPLTLDSRAGVSEFLKSGLSQDDIMTQFVGAIGSGLGRTVAEWAGRDGNTAGMIGASTASQSYTETIANGRNDRDQAAAAHLKTLVIKPVDLAPIAINSSALTDLSFLDSVRPPGPTPEESQAAFRDSERAYRSSTDTGAVVQKGDRLEILAGRDKVMMGRYIAGMGLKDPNALQVGQAMVANWDMSDAEAEALSDKFYVADAKVKAAAAAAAAQAKADAIAARRSAEQDRMTANTSAFEGATTGQAALSGAIGKRSDGMELKLGDATLPGIPSRTADHYRSILAGDTASLPSGVKYIKGGEGWGPMVLDESTLHIKSFGNTSAHQIVKGLVTKGLNNYLEYEPYSSMSQFAVRDMGPVKVGQIYDVKIWPMGLADNGTVVLTKWENDTVTGMPMFRLSTTDTRDAASSVNVTGQHAVSGGRDITFEPNPKGRYTLVNRGVSRATNWWVSDGEKVLDWTFFRNEGGAQNANWERFIQGVANKVVASGGSVGEKTSTIYHYPNNPIQSNVVIQPGVQPVLVQKRKF